MTTYPLIRLIPYQRLVSINIPKASFRLFWIISILSIIFFLVLYLYQVNAEVSERYSIQEYQRKIDEISKENKSLEINSAKIGSLDSITLLLQGLNFEKADKVHYIQILDTQVVAK